VAENRFRARLWRTAWSEVRGTTHRNSIAVWTGARVHLLELVARTRQPFSFEAPRVGIPGLYDRPYLSSFGLEGGPMTVGYAFLRKSSAISNPLNRPVETAITISGDSYYGIPTLVMYRLSVPLRRRDFGNSDLASGILTCRGPEGRQPRGGAAARKFSPSGSLAYRRPVTKDKRRGCCGCACMRS